MIRVLSCIIFLCKKKLFYGNAYDRTYWDYLETTLIYVKRACDSVDLTCVINVIYTSIYYSEEEMEIFICDITEGKGR